jgi:hypothetical protein
LSNDSLNKKSNLSADKISFSPCPTVESFQYWKEKENRYIAQITNLKTELDTLKHTYSHYCSTIRQDSRRKVLPPLLDSSHGNGDNSSISSPLEFQFNQTTTENYDIAYEVEGESSTPRLNVISDINLCNSKMIHINRSSQTDNCVSPGNANIDTIIMQKTKTLHDLISELSIALKDSATNLTESALKRAESERYNYKLLNELNNSRDQLQIYMNKINSLENILYGCKGNGVENEVKSDVETKEIDMQKKNSSLDRFVGNKQVLLKSGNLCGNFPM